MDNRATEAQWEVLLSLLANDKELLHGQFLAAGGVVRTKRRWEEVAITLNAVPSGASKSGEEWKLAWNGLKNRAREQLRSKARYMRGTGGGPVAECVGLGLSPLYETVLNMTGVTAAVGTDCPDPLQIQLDLGQDPVVPGAVQHRVPVAVQRARVPAQGVRHGVQQPMPVAGPAVGDIQPQELVQLQEWHPLTLEDMEPHALQLPDLHPVALGEAGAAQPLIFKEEIDSIVMEYQAKKLDKPVVFVDLSNSPSPLNVKEEVGFVKVGEDGMDKQEKPFSCVDLTDSPPSPLIVASGSSMETTGQLVDAVLVTDAMDLAMKANIGQVVHGNTVLLRSLLEVICALKRL